ncbi:ATP-dependent DNA ligase [archaeon]|nr:ATP-dependent DNA ligase [archaeon]
MGYLAFVSLFEEIEKTSKRLHKTWLISRFLASVPADEIKEIVYLLQGTVFPSASEKKVGVSGKILVKAIAQSIGEDSALVEALLAKRGDLGLVAADLIEKRKQKLLFQRKLGVSFVCKTIRDIAEFEGEGTVQKKIMKIMELLGPASSLEAKYIVRIINEKMRGGVGTGTIRDALAWAFFPKVVGIFFRCENCRLFNPNVHNCLNCNSEIENKFNKESEKDYAKALKPISQDEISFKQDIILPKSEHEARRIYNLLIERVQNAYDITADLGEVAEILAKKGAKGLDNIALVPGRAIKVMLYQKAKDIKDGFEQVGKPAILEPKLDGFRMQIHRIGDRLTLFTRRLEDVTKQFPDVYLAAKENIKSKNYIVDCEVVGIDPHTKKAVPFQNISQRIKRKYGIDEMAKELPVKAVVFDAMQINERNLINEQLNERRKRLASIIHNAKHKIELIEQVITGDLKKAEEYYKGCLNEGHEGIMMKKASGIYKPGSRVGFGVKIKPVMETLDLVITGAEWGEGKRAKWLSSFTVACRDEKTGKLLDIGQVGTGIKEKAELGTSFEELTKEIEIIEEKGKEVIVKPKIVLEVGFQEIQKSPSYSSGFALRFPKLVRVRWDRGVGDISSLKEVRKAYGLQKK